MNRTCDTRIRNHYPTPLGPNKLPTSQHNIPSLKGEICSRESKLTRTQTLFTHEFPHTSDPKKLPWTGHDLLPQGGVGVRDLPRKRSPRQRPRPSSEIDICKTALAYQQPLKKFLDKTHLEVLFVILNNTLYSTINRRCRVATETKKISFDCSNEVLERLDKLAKKGDIPRSRLIANLVEVGVETLEDCQKIGLFQVSLLIRNMGEYLQTWSKKMKNRKDLEGLL